MEKGSKKIHTILKEKKMGRTRTEINIIAIFGEDDVDREFFFEELPSLQIQDAEEKEENPNE